MAVIIESELGLSECNIVAEFTKWHARPWMREITFRVKRE